MAVKNNKIVGKKTADKTGRAKVVKSSKNKAVAAKKTTTAAPAPKSKTPAKKTTIKKSVKVSVKAKGEAVAKKSADKTKKAKEQSKTTAELLKAIKARDAQAQAAGKTVAKKVKSDKSKAKRAKSIPIQPIPIVPPMQKPVEIVPSSKSKPKRKQAKFNKTELKKFKEDLLVMRSHFTDQTVAMKHDALYRDDEVNPEEDGTDAFMRLQALNQMNNQQHIIAEIDQALTAIAKGNYGVCEMCGCLINKARLAVRPFAKFCITCKSEIENGGRRKRPR